MGRSCSSSSANKTPRPPSMSGKLSIPGPGNGGVPLGDGDREDPRRRGWDREAEGEVRNGSCEGLDGDAGRKICEMSAAYC